MQYKLFITYMEFIIILFLLVLNGVFAMYEERCAIQQSTDSKTLAGKGKTKEPKEYSKQLQEPDKFLLPFQLVSRLSVLYPVLSVV